MTESWRGVERIISGGQTGVDRAALDVAIELGIPHGGWCPRGRLAEDGPLDPRYELAETDSPRYHVRTERNVREGDGTLLLYRQSLAGGSELTRQLAADHGRPYLLVDLAAEAPVAPEAALAEARAWLGERRIATLNVAGPRESSAAGIYAQAAEFLKRMLAGAPPEPAGGTANELP